MSSFFDRKRDYMENKKYYWIKLRKDFFERDDIDFILSQEKGCEYIVLYQMLCMKASNNDGFLGTKIDEMIVPYDVKKITRDCKYFDYDTIIVALELYKKLGLVYEEENRVLKITDYDKLVGCETAWAEKKRQQRLNNIPLKNCKRLNGEMLRLPNGNSVFVDEKRYGGNGMLAYDLANGKCEICGSEENLCIHHNNGYSNDIKDLYILCRKCHSKVEGKGVEIVHPYVRQEIEIEKDIEKEIDIDNNINNITDAKQVLSTDIFDYYQEHIGILSPNQYEKMNEYITKYSEDKIKEAIDTSCDNGVKTFNYFSSVLTNGVFKKGTIIAYKKQNNTPEWMNKEQQSEEMSEDELAELEKEMSIF